MPIDVTVEVMAGFALAIIGTVFAYMAKMKDISYGAQYAGKTFEHFHSKKTLRNVQKTRSFVFNTLLSRKDSAFMSVEEAVKLNPALKSLLS